MVESRWLRWIGPGVVAIGAVGLVASATAGAAVRPWAPRACAGPPGAIAAAAGGARPADLGDLASVPWFRQDPVVDGAGDAARPARRDRPRRGLGWSGPWTCPPNRSPPGRSAVIVLVGSDDGTASRLVAVDVAGGCSWPIAEERDVIRRATVDPTGTSIIEMRVDRVSRADRRDLAPADRRPGRSSPDPRSHRRPTVGSAAPGRPSSRGRSRATGSPSSRAGRSPAGRASCLWTGRPSLRPRRCSTRRTSGSSSAWTATTS